MAMNRPDFAAGVNGLLPAIAQDASTKQVLMFAWMNEESYAETLVTGFATYYRRSRKRLGRKGEESGHRQHVLEIRLDCDADCILLLIEQAGSACHKGYVSCFYRKREDGEFVIDQERLVAPEKVYKKPHG